MYTVVTSFSEEGYDLYGKNFLESFIKHWPEEVALRVYYHDMELPEDKPEAANLLYFNLNEVTDHEEWYKQFGAAKGILPDNTYSYRMDAAKFAHKIFAYTDSASHVEEGAMLIWLDADTVAVEDVTLEDLKEWVSEEVIVTYLDRTTINYAETSFFAIQLNDLGLYFIGDLKGTYLSGELFNYGEWHDGFVFTRLVRYHAAHGLPVKNLSEGVQDLEAFMYSPVGNKLVHLKGNKKENGKGVSTRYDLLNELVLHYMPETICEVGTWNGDRAIQMMYHALQNNSDVRYIGFDLFEEATEETDDEEFNTKKHTSLKEVSGKLEEFAAQAKEQGKNVTFELHKGNTNKTMAGVDLSGVDFAWVDGGHSYDTVRNDWSYLSHVPVVAFDDYFSADQGGHGPDEEHCGTNALIENDLKGEQYRKYIFESRDPVMGGGVTHIALVITKADAWEPPSFRLTKQGEQGGIRIQPKDSRPKEYIADNIKYALSRIEKWVPRCNVHGGEVIIASAGPSLKDHLKELKAAYKEGKKIVCVKHSLPILAGAGIVPWGCIILDPRPFNEKSTHGKVRSSLVDRAPKETIYFVASMTDKEFVDHLVDNGYNVQGWHAWNSAVQLVPELQEENGPHFFVQGGTCSAMRAVGLLHTMGFRRFIMYGYDSCHAGKPDNPKERDEKGNPKWFQVEVNGKTFYSTGELIAQAQDAEELFKRMDKEVDIYLEVKPSGIVYEVWKNQIAPRYADHKEFSEDLLN